MGRSSQLYRQPIVRRRLRSLPIARFANRRVEHGPFPALNLASPKTKHEADVIALKLFCLLSFLLVGLITAGVL